MFRSAMTQMPATDDPLGPILNVPPPALTEAECLAAVAAHWGIDGRLEPLTSERDLNFRLRTGQGDFVLKVVNAAEDAGVTEFQTLALDHIAARDPALPVPRAIRARDGAASVLLAGGNRMRLLSWVEGVPMHRAPTSAALRRGMGTMAARLTRALEGFDHPAARHVLQWDIKHASRLRPLLPAIADADLRAICTRWLDRFDRQVGPRLMGLPWQVVHADLNPHNVLTAPDDPAHISGVLDFGDMVFTPRICDLAVAAAYQLNPDEAEASLMQVAEGWASILPLLPVEAALLRDLTAIRMVTTLAITSHRAARQPGNAPYILRNFPGARAGLLALPCPD
jgi:Ser/Thr protein kinase RdoA (MazF antagonist)